MYIYNAWYYIDISTDVWGACMTVHCDLGDMHLWSRECPFRCPVAQLGQLAVPWLRALCARIGSPVKRGPGWSMWKQHVYKHTPTHTHTKLNMTFMFNIISHMFTLLYIWMMIYWPSYTHLHVQVLVVIYMRTHTYTHIYYAYIPWTSCHALF